MMHPAVLPKKTSQLVNNFQQVGADFLQPFYLSGGTALALQLRHRESIHLDCFSHNPFSPEAVLAQLQSFGRPTGVAMSHGTLNCFVRGVQLQFLEYRYPLLQPTVSWSGLNVSGVLDVAATKLHTISARGSKKDFIDLWRVLQEGYTLQELCKALEKNIRMFTITPSTL
ncbi:MAG: nucleotidyl transferase AbiEii/AbiGii toxin family protein [Pseudomonadales bacterium]|nr:nucleotidyl transferase AbiEii/AbiGii toxin family protein [Pseudomonadales bacterium]